MTAGVLRTVSIDEIDPKVREIVVYNWHRNYAGNLEKRALRAEEKLAEYNDMIASALENATLLDRGRATVEYENFKRFKYQLLEQQCEHFAVYCVTGM